ncbi:MAG TPA: glutathione S-transferase family protein [Rhodanobacteraceae bacterium]|jgi:glutathione S-transferase|nr:glutathione S-transferase family protein [Rhodanobacteraceae bacterium]
MYTLYYSPGAASLVVHLALLEAGADYKLERVDLDAGAQRDPAYLKLNPNGMVPTLVIDGEPFYEAAACLMTVADRHPQAALAPRPDTLQRAAWNQWIIHIANTVQPAFRMWFYPNELGGVPAEAIAARIESAWTRFDTHLAANGPYLLGEACTGADLMLLMVMRWSRNMPRPATEWPALRAFAARMKARPSWKRLYELEGLTEWA